MKRNRDRGFTLIEVVVASAVFAMVATALFGLFSKSLFNLRKIEDVHQYQLAGEEVLNRVMMLPNLPVDARAEGGVEGLDARWVVTVRPWNSTISHIGVEVVWPGRSGPRSISLETIRPVPPPADKNYDLAQAIENIVPR